MIFSPNQTEASPTIQLFEDTADEPDETFQITLSNPINATLGSRSVSTITIQDDDEPLAVPALQNFTITSTTGPYALGEAIEVTATFSEAVTVTGSPRIPLDIGGETKYATYQSGSATTALVFSYTPVTGDNDANGVTIAANTLELDGGTIRVGATDATLTHPAVAADAANAVDTVAPVLQGNPASNADGTQIVLTYDEALGTSVSIPGFVVHAPRTHPRSPSAAEVDGMTVVLTLRPAQVMRVGETVTLDLTASAGLKDAAGNPAPAFSGQAVDNNVVSGPAVESVAFTSNAGADDTYAIGDAVEATLTFTEAVDVDTESGTPHVRVWFSDNDRRCNAAYDRGSGGTALVFVCAVQEGDRDSNGVVVSQD